MAPRPRILLAIEPPLLADLVRRALDQDDVEIEIIDDPGAAVGAWDIAVVSRSGQEYLYARHVVAPAEIDGSDFDSLVAQIRRACGR